MREAGLRTWLDAVGNVHGRVDGRARDAPALILGSHYDTVMDAGKYDGALGIIVAIASVKASLLKVGVKTRHDTLLQHAHRQPDTVVCLPHTMPHDHMLHSQPLPTHRSTLRRGCSGTTEQY